MRFAKWHQTALERYAQHEKAINRLYFLAGLIFILLYVTRPVTDGFFPSEIISVLVNTGVLLFLFARTAFQKPLIGQLLRDAHPVECAAAALLASAGSIYTALLFYNTFFAGIFDGGDKPGIVYAIYRRIPLPAVVSNAVIAAGIVLCALVAAFALFFLALRYVRVARLALVHTFRQPDYQPVDPPASKKTRVLLAAAMALACGLLCFGILHKGQEWGADYTTYISQALKFESGDASSIGIVWGFGAMLVPILRIFGYDRMGFTSIIYYKIPCVLCLVLLVFVLYLLFSKRFSAVKSFILTAVFAFGIVFVDYTNEILTNIPHMLFSTLAVGCMYGLFTGKTKMQQWIFGIAGGICIGCADLIRVNGVLLLLALVCMQFGWLLCLLLKKHGFFNGFLKYISVKSYPAQLTPYVLYFAVKKIASLTLNARTYTAVAAAYVPTTMTVSLFDGLQYYAKHIFGFFRAMLPFDLLPELAWLIILPLVLIGIVRTFRREIFSHIYCWGTLVFYALLVFRQGIRYLFPILPIIVLFMGVGMQTVEECTLAADGAPMPAPGRKRRLPSCLKSCGALTLCCLAIAVGQFVETGYHAAENLANHRVYDHMSFSESAKKTYRYIIENIEEDANIVFFKEAVISLNTERQSGTSLPEDSERKSYLLLTNDSVGGYNQIPGEYATLAEMEKETGYRAVLIYENDRFWLYELQKEAVS